MLKSHFKQFYVIIRLTFNLSEMTAFVSQSNVVNCTGFNLIWRYVADAGYPWSQNQRALEREEILPSRTEAFQRGAKSGCVSLIRGGSSSETILFWNKHLLKTRILLGLRDEHEAKFVPCSGVCSCEWDALAILNHALFLCFCWLGSEKKRDQICSGHTQLFATPRTIACLAPLSIGSSSQEHCSGLPFPSPGALHRPGIEPESPALVGGFFPTEPPGRPIHS